MSVGELFAFAFMMMAFPLVIGTFCALVDWVLERVGGR